GQVPELPRILSRNFPPPRQIRFESSQLRESKRTGNIGQPVVESQHAHLIKPLPRLLPLARSATNPVIAKTSQGVSQPRAISRDHAAFAGGQVFHRVKAKHSHVGKAANTFSAAFRAQRVARVFNKKSALLFRNLPQFVERRRVSCV